MMLFLVLFIHSILAQDLETNNKCSYTLGKNVFTCTGLSDVDKNVDQFITSETRMLVIKNSPVAQFKPYHHNRTRYQHIVNYNIIDNGELIVDEYGFYGLFNLHYMKITGNNFETLKNNVFEGLDKVELLELSNNNISSVQPNAFKGLKNLITLAIAENRIEVIQSDTFKQQSNLHTLLFSNNYVKSVEDDAFSGLVNLELLDLTRNSLKTLDSKPFNALVRLKTVYFNFNEIREIEGSLRLNDLKFLEVHNNKLREITEENLRGVQNIINIDLSNNLLNSLTERPFLNLSFLKHLNLRNNSASESHFIELKKRLSVVV